MKNNIMQMCRDKKRCKWFVKIRSVKEKLGIFRELLGFAVNYSWDEKSTTKKGDNNDETRHSTQLWSPTSYYT